MNNSYETTIRKGLENLSKKLNSCAFDKKVGAVTLTKNIKAISEILLTGSICKHKGIALAEADELFEKSWEYLDEGKLIIWILSQHPQLSTLTNLYARLFNAGYRNGGVEHAIKHLYTEDHYTAFYDREWKKSSVLLALQDIFSTHPKHFPELDLKPFLNAFFVWDKQAYDLTHQVFYFTNFGRYNCQNLHMTDEQIAWLTCFLPIWISYYGETGNFDIFCELMIAKHLLNKHISIESYGDVERTVTNEIVSMLHLKGKVPIYRKCQDKVYKPDQLDDASYHSTLVSIIMLALDDNTKTPNVFTK